MAYGLQDNMKMYEVRLDAHSAVRLVSRLLQEGSTEVIEVRDDRGGIGDVIVRASSSHRSLPPAVSDRRLPSDPKDYDWKEVEP